MILCYAGLSEIVSAEAGRPDLFSQHVAAGILIRQDPYVLLEDPAILILDEATASVDPLTEAQIQEGLDQVLWGRTAIIIRAPALDHPTRRPHHRVAGGRILEEGTTPRYCGPGATMPSSTIPTSAINRPITGPARAS
jgi:hypothetical protein